MRIAIDYTAAARQGGGIGRYARELITAILRAPNPHTFTLLTATAGLGERWSREQARLREVAPDLARLKFRALPLTDDWMARLWQRLRLPLPAEALTGGCEGFYSPDFVLPPLRPRTPALLTIHDLSFLRHPETFTAPLRRYLETCVPRSVRRATHILADSEATRRDILELLDVAPERVSVLYSGVSPHFTPTAEPDERARLHTRYRIGARPYILSVGTLQPRKNYVRLMEACAPLNRAGNVELVIVGQPAWLAEPILEAAARRAYVHILGFVDDGDLPALYRQATAFAFPSLYEGFGIPPLEALACGTPVVASSASSVPEVVGDAGIQVDPLDVDGWTAALRRVCEDAALRAALIARGTKRAAHFTWEAAAQRWLALVEETVNRQRSVL